MQARLRSSNVLSTGLVAEADVQRVRPHVVDAGAAAGGTRRSRRGDELFVNSWRP